MSRKAKRGDLLGTILKSQVASGALVAFIALFTFAAERFHFAVFSIAPTAQGDLLASAPTAATLLGTGLMSATLLGVTIVALLAALGPLLRKGGLAVSWEVPDPLGLLAAAAATLFLAAIVLPPIFALGVAFNLLLTDPATLAKAGPESGAGASAAIANLLIHPGGLGRSFLFAAEILAAVLLGVVLLGLRRAPRCPGRLAAMAVAGTLLAVNVAVTLPITAGVLLIQKTGDPARVVLKGRQPGEPGTTLAGFLLQIGPDQVAFYERPKGPRTDRESPLHLLARDAIFDIHLLNPVENSNMIRHHLCERPSKNPATTTGQLTACREGGYLHERRLLLWLPHLFLMLAAMTLGIHGARAGDGSSAPPPAQTGKGGQAAGSNTALGFFGYLAETSEQLAAMIDRLVIVGRGGAEQESEPAARALDVFRLDPRNGSLQRLAHEGGHRSPRMRGDGTLMYLSDGRLRIAGTDRPAGQQGPDKLVAILGWSNETGEVLVEDRDGRLLRVSEHQSSAPDELPLDPDVPPYLTRRTLRQLARSNSRARSLGVQRAGDTWQLFEDAASYEERKVLLTSDQPLFDPSYLPDGESVLFVSSGTATLAPSPPPSDSERSGVASGKHDGSEPVKSASGQ